MQAKVYNLPEISFVGGETHDLLFHLFTETGRVFSASGATATFSIVGSVNRTGAPVLSKPMTVLADDNGVESIIAVTLLPTETVGWEVHLSNYNPGYVGRNRDTPSRHFGYHEQY